MSSKKATIYLSDNIQRILGKIGDRGFSGRIADVVDCYGEMVRRADQGLQAKLTPDEIRAVGTVIRGKVWEPAALIEEGLPRSLADAGHLAEKIRSLSFYEKIALVEHCRK